jgi:hypothetical protein
MTILCRGTTIAASPLRPPDAPGGCLTIRSDLLSFISGVHVRGDACDHEVRGW